MLMALCLSPHDLAHGCELLRLWADLEDSFNPRIGVAVCLRFDMKENIPELNAALALVRQKFKVHIHVSKRRITGWPAGCNGLELDAYEWFVFENRANRFDYDYIFIIEADTVPLWRGWADEIMNEAYDHQSVISGAMLFHPDCPCEHINANCVIHKLAWKKIRKIFHSPSRWGWDAYIGVEAIRCGTASRLIWQDYRLGMPDNPWRGNDYLFAPRAYQSPKSPLYGQQLQPAFLHGVKILDGIKAVRDRLLLT